MCYVVFDLVCSGVFLFNAGVLNLLQAGPPKAGSLQVPPPATHTHTHTHPHPHTDAVRGP